MNPAVTLAFALTISITFHKGDKIFCYVQLSVTYLRSSKKSPLSFYSHLELVGCVEQWWNVGL